MQCRDKSPPSSLSVKLSVRSVRYTSELEILLLHPGLHEPGQASVAH